MPFCVLRCPPGATSVERTGERWKPLGLAHEGQNLLVNGASVWDAAWQPQKRAISLKHPQYPSQVHRASVYALPDDEPPCCSPSPRCR